MVAPNTQLSPLQHHSKSSSMLSSSFKNYSRIQSEVQREGFEIHKENLLSLSLSRKNKHSVTEEQIEAPIPSSLQTGPSHTSRKTWLQSLLSAEMGNMSHGHIAQPHEQEVVHKELMASCEKSLLLPSGASPTRSLSSSLSSLLPSGASPTRSLSSSLSSLLSQEANNVYKYYSEIFPQAYTPMSACLTTSLHQKQEYSLPQSMMVEHVEVGKSTLNVGSVEADAGVEAGNVKRLKYTLIGEDGTCMRSFGVQNSEEGFASCCVIGGGVAQDAASNVCIGDMGVLNWESKSKGCLAASRGTLFTTEISEAPSATGLKLFTTSIHAQMPRTLSTFSEGEPSLPHSLELSQQQASTRTQKYEGFCADADWGKFLALSATPIAVDAATANARVLPFQQRFKQLQAFLKQCDDADQNECMYALRSLSAAARSGHAVELETRAIRLSLEEGKEMRRMRFLNVLGKISERSLDDAGATPQGPRLPAPGVAVKFKSVPQ